MDLIEVRAGLECLGEHLIGRHPEDAFFLFELVGRERTERTSGKTDVRRVDVAIEHVKDFFAALAFFRGPRQRAQAVQVGGAIECDPVFERQGNVGVDLACYAGERRVAVYQGGPFYEGRERGSNLRVYSSGAPRAAQQRFPGVRPRRRR